MTPVRRAPAGLTREDAAAVICRGAVANAHRELALLIAAAETDRLPAYLLPTLRHIELMLRPDTIRELGERLLEERRCPLQ
jgi:hypothetical protein